MAGIVVGAGKFTTTASTKSSNLLASSNYQTVGPGIIQLAIKSSVTGVNVTFQVAGQALIDDVVIPFTGTAGTLDVQANTMVSQTIGGGLLNLTVRDTTAGTPTVDYIVTFFPSGKK